MKTIARINADGSLLIKGEIFELLPSWDDADKSDEDFEIDEDTEIDEDMHFEDFMEIITGLESKLKNYDEISFDEDGNVSVQEVLEGLKVALTDNYKLEIDEIREKEDL